MPPNSEILASVCLHFSIFRTLANRHFIKLNTCLRLVKSSLPHRGLLMLILCDIQMIPFGIENLQYYSFVSLSVFGLLSSSLFFSKRFGRYVRPSSGVCRTREPTRNFELRPLLNPLGSPVLIPFAITGYKVISIPVLLLACSQDWTYNLQMIVSSEA